MCVLKSVVEKMMLNLISEVVRLSKSGMSEVEILRIMSGDGGEGEKMNGGEIIKSKSKIESSIVLPWCGYVDSENCHGLRLNHNLFYSVQ